MKKGVLAWIIIAVSLIFIGAMLIGISFINIGDNFDMLNSSKYEEKIYDITDSFTDIIIEGSDTDIILLPSDNNICKVVCYEFTRAKYSVLAENGTLTVKESNQKRWYDYIGINFISPQVKVYLPEEAYKSLTVSNSTGDIKISESLYFENATISGRASSVVMLGDAKSIAISVSTGDISIINVPGADNISLAVTTGDIKAVNISCSTISLNGRTGDIKLKNVIATTALTAKLRTGDIDLEKCDAGAISITTTTGDIDGTLLSPKKFVVSTSTGDIDIPQTNEGGACELKTTTGDIEIKIANK